MCPWACREIFEPITPRTVIARTDLRTEPTNNRKLSNLPKGLTGFPRPADIPDCENGESPMTCPNCSSVVPNDNTFCGKCGFKLKGDAGDLERRIASMEKQRDGHEQKLLEMETVENVMDKIQSRVMRFTYFAGIPLAIAVIALAVMFGKGVYTLEGIAANAKNSIEPLVNETKTRAAETKNTIEQVQQQLKPAQEELTHLREQAATAIGNVKQLDGRLKTSQSDLEALTARVNSEDQRVTQLAQQVKHVETQKSVATIRETFPTVYGDLIAGSREGFIDPNAKKPDAIWVVLSLSGNARADQITAMKMAELQQSLESNGFTVILGWVSLYKSTGKTSSHIGPSLGEGSCTGLAGVPPPCVLYLQQKFRDQAERVRQLVNSTRLIAPDHVLPPKSLTDGYSQLLEKSAIDLVIVL